MKWQCTMNCGPANGAKISMPCSDCMPRTYDDSVRLEYVLGSGALVQRQNGMDHKWVWQLYWPFLGRSQQQWYSTERKAIDAALNGEDDESEPAADGGADV